MFFSNLLFWLTACQTGSGYRTRRRCWPPPLARTGPATLQYRRYCTRTIPARTVPVLHPPTPSALAPPPLRIIEKKHSFLGEIGRYQKTKCLGWISAQKRKSKIYDLQSPYCQLSATHTHTFTILPCSFLPLNYPYMSPHKSIIH
jgi:hypothetical protein